MSVRRVILAALPLALATVGFFGSVSAQAQAFPNKQITIVAAYPPGGDVDALARVFAEKLAIRTGQTVIVDNKVGASGTIGASLVAKAPADVYTVLYAPSTFAIAPLVLKTGTGAIYDPIGDFVPVMATGTASLFVVAAPQSGLKDTKELVAAAKAGKLAGAAPAVAPPCTCWAKWSTGPLARRSSKCHIAAWAQPLPI